MQTVTIGFYLYQQRAAEQSLPWIILVIRIIGVQLNRACGQASSVKFGLPSAYSGSYKAPGAQHVVHRLDAFEPSQPLLATSHDLKTVPILFHISATMSEFRDLIGRIRSLHAPDDAEILSSSIEVCSSHGRARKEREKFSSFMKMLKLLSGTILLTLSFWNAGKLDLYQPCRQQSSSCVSNSMKHL